MNKSQTILAAIGGTAVVGALVLGYLIFDASGVKGENEERLETGVEGARGVMKKLPVKAEPAELKVFRDNAAAYDDWRAEAEKIAARGDLVFEPTTPAVFKTTLVNDARRIAAMPGCLDGRFAKADFGFGFREYVVGGAMPPEADLKRLQREWNDVSSVLMTLAECGGTGIGVTELTMGKAKAEVAEEEDPAAKKKAKRKVNAKKNAKKTEEAEAGPAITSFTVEFVARPSALVKALNAFTTGSRFVVVENCTFVRESDALRATLDGESKSGNERPSARRRRAAAAAEAQETKDDAKALLVTDPLTAPKLKVKMAVSVYEFGTLEKVKAEDAAKEGESK